jgi:excisionase family DNA binding protein
MIRAKPTSIEAKLCKKSPDKTVNKIQNVSSVRSSYPHRPETDSALPFSSSLKTETWLDSREAALYLRLSLGALRNMTSNGQVPYYKLGARNRYLKSDLQRLLLQNRRGEAKWELK